MRSIAIAICAVAALSASSSAAPPACKRWVNQLTTCEALGIPVAPGKQCNPTPAQVEEAAGVIHRGSPTLACKAWISHVSPTPSNYTPGKEIKACSWSTNPAVKTCLPVNWADGKAYCVFDGDGDGDIDYDDVAVTSSRIVYFQDVMPDPHCFCTANGPYKDLTWTPSSSSTWNAWYVYALWLFPYSLKQAILLQNGGPNGTNFHSDAPFDPHQVLQKTDIYEADAAEIDHIIPRIDSHGCLCGTGTKSNAAVISRQMNAEMSNTSPSWNLNRSKMFAKWVSCPDPSVATYKGPQNPVPPAFNMARQQPDETVFEIDVGIPPR